MAQLRRLWPVCCSQTRARKPTRDVRKIHFKGYSSRFCIKKDMLMTLSTSKYDNDFITKGTFVEAFYIIINLFEKGTMYHFNINGTNSCIVPNSANG